jgi:two-component system cell cycle sensor histidine kinase/response regulator CckA
MNMAWSRSAAVEAERAPSPATDGGTGVMVAVRDTAGDREARRRLEESEQRYRSLFEYNPAAVFSLDLDGGFTSANPAAYALTGYAPGELLGRPFNALVVPEHLPRVAEDFRAAVGGASRTLRAAITHSDGRRLELRVTTTPVVVAGEVVGVFGIADDITERVGAQEALRKSEEMLRTVIDASPVAIVMLDRNGNVVTWSSAAERMFGWTADEARNRPPPFIPPEAEPDFHARLEQVLGGEPLMGLELVRRRRDGAAVPISLCAAPLRDEDGSVTGVVVAIVDETARRAVEVALQESRQQLLHAQKMEAVGRLAGGIAHDFNNLLTAIKGGAQMLLLDTPESSSAHADLVEIDQSVDRATNLTRQLLTFSRKAVAQPRALDLNALLAGTEKLLKRVLREDVVLSTCFCPGRACILADRGQVEQVLLNLAVNARDAMPAGGNLTLETSTVELAGPFGPEHAGMLPGRYVVLCVSDTGQGMTQDVQDRAFEPFFTTKPRGQGTGLGLSTVYGIVQQSGGMIQLQSETGRGTTFRIFFPEAPGDGADEVVARPGGGGAREETLLVVEDEPAVRNVVERVLKRSGYRVLLAGTGEEALDLLAREKGAVALLVTDVVMPGMSGAELAGRARGLRPGLPVLFMSGYDDEVVSHHGVLNAGVEFIQKPFSPQVLASRVREVLDGAHRS